MSKAPTTTKTPRRRRKSNEEEGRGGIDVTTVMVNLICISLSPPTPTYKWPSLYSLAGRYSKLLTQIFDHGSMQKPLFLLSYVGKSLDGAEEILFNR